jgi:glucose-6-phosphate 1-dehydrogenase
VTITLLAKRPGGGDVATEVPASVDFRTVLGAAEQPYERILADALAGDPTHFARMDSLKEAWRIVSLALDMTTKPLPYPVRSWGPVAADDMPGERDWQSLPAPPDHRPTTDANPT